MDMCGHRFPTAEAVGYFPASLRDVHKDTPIEPLPKDLTECRAGRPAPRLHLDGNRILISATGIKAHWYHRYNNNNYYSKLKSRHAVVKKVLTLIIDRSIISLVRFYRTAFMVKEDTRARIIEHGAMLIHEKGFNHTGVQEILRAAGVPKGSFYFYFKSKEEFGLAVIDYFSQYLGARMNTHLEDSSLPHVGRLKSFCDEMLEYFRMVGCTRGCPIGNMAQELADLSDTFRAKLKDALDEMGTQMAACLQAAREANELDPDLDPHETAHFIVNSWEGALTRMKTEKTLEPLIVFDKMIFGRLLRPPVEHRLPDP